MTFLDSASDGEQESPLGVESINEVSVDTVQRATDGAQVIARDGIPLMGA
jgi:hypothetical protein